MSNEHRHRVRYDPDADAASVYLDKRCNVAQTRELADDVIVEYSKSGRLIAVEFLGVSEYFQYDPQVNNWWFSWEFKEPLGNAIGGGCKTLEKALSHAGRSSGV